ncbi:SET domain containing protein, putative [Angomonas deanei]|uniref:SET domain containing protein, putative n=1 Tax=Angomonas deanei TaxID=59799 RepID=A0A7G2CPJ7_9TRYP|nr:SET domain containing protein, putative [Angomonas deanei]
MFKISVVRRLAKWSSLLADPRTVQYVQSVRQSYPTPNGHRQGRSSIPVRGIVATRKFARGQTIAEIKLEHILEGESAVALLHAFLSANRKEGSGLPSFNELWSTVIAILANIQQHEDKLLLSSTLYYTRDGICLWLALHFLRFYSDECPPEQLSLKNWILDFPPKVPPIGLLLHEALYKPPSVTDHTNANHNTSNSLLQRQLRLGQYTQPVEPTKVPPAHEEEKSDDALTVQSSGTESVQKKIQKQKQALLLKVLQEEGIERLREEGTQITTEVVLTDEMKANYLKQSITDSTNPSGKFSLTVRQRETQHAQFNRLGDSESVKHCTQLQNEVERLFIEPVAKLLSSVSKGDPQEEEERVKAELRWSHSMLRSRALNLFSNTKADRSTNKDDNTNNTVQVRLSLIPLLDRLNHSANGANVLYTWTPSPQPMIKITAKQNIAVGEELVLHYADKYERGVLTGTLFTNPSHHLNNKQKNMRENITKMEKKQRLEFTQDDDENSNSGNKSTTFRTVESIGITTNDKDGLEEVRREVRWLFLYGFMRSEQEKLNEIYKIWQSSLVSRAAQLTDIRLGAHVHGTHNNNNNKDNDQNKRKVEYVVGVPEGLAFLKQQREALEREKYNNQRVFPPQREL